MGQGLISGIESRKRYYDKKRSQGICLRCKNKATPGYFHCYDCRKKYREEYHKRVKRIRLNEKEKS